MSPHAIYCAFDRFPSAKGASTHISHVTKVLFSQYDENLLLCLGSDLPKEETKEERGSVVHTHRFQDEIINFLERTIAFSCFVTKELNQHGSQLKICHFRDPWSGVAICDWAQAQERDIFLVYEVNALPSIELPYSYDDINKITLAKISDQEMYCLTIANEIITPSKLTAKMLETLGISPHKITMVPNGANIINHEVKVVSQPPYAIYFGALQPWQGILVLLKAWALVNELRPTKLYICAALNNRSARRYVKLAQEMELSDQIVWQYGLDKKELSTLVRGATLSLAPLTACSRNTKQGCAPLKILESMAEETPLIASNLSVVKELIEDDVHGLLIQPNRPEVLAQAVLKLLENPALAQQMGKAALAHLKNNFLWEHSDKKLLNVYKKRRHHE